MGSSARLSFWSGFKNSFFISHFFKRNSTKGTSHTVNFICNAPIIYIGDAFYVVGGYSGTYEKTIGKLDTNSNWSIAGELSRARRDHSVIYDGTYMLVVGGFDNDFKTEKCTFTGNEVSCREQSPSLNQYQEYPELFLVQADFCKSLP